MGRWRPSGSSGGRSRGNVAYNAGGLHACDRGGRLRLQAARRDAGVARPPAGFVPVAALVAAVFFVNTMLVGVVVVADDGHAAPVPSSGTSSRSSCRPSPARRGSGSRSAASPSEPRGRSSRSCRSSSVSTRRTRGSRCCTRRRRARARGIREFSWTSGNPRRSVTRRASRRWWQARDVARAAGVAGRPPALGRTSARPRQDRRRLDRAHASARSLQQRVGVDAPAPAPLRTPAPPLPLAVPEARAIEYHHERYDGMGYYGIAQNDVPLAAHFLIVADSYDAMISDRPYRRALPRERALGEIERGAGEQFHPVVAKAFVALQRGFDPLKMLTPEERELLRSTSMPSGRRGKWLRRVARRPVVLPVAALVAALTAAGLAQYALASRRARSLRRRAVPPGVGGEDRAPSRRPAEGRGGCRGSPRRRARPRRRGRARAVGRRARVGRARARRDDHPAERRPRGRADGDGDHELDRPRRGERRRAARHRGRARARAARRVAAAHGRRDLGVPRAPARPSASEQAGGRASRRGAGAHADARPDGPTKRHPRPHWPPSVRCSSCRASCWASSSPRCSADVWSACWRFGFARRGSSSRRSARRSRSSRSSRCRPACTTRRICSATPSSSRLRS